MDILISLLSPAIEVWKWIYSKLKGRNTKKNINFVTGYQMYGIYGNKDIGKVRLFGVDWILRLPTHSAFITPSPSEWAEQLQVLGPYCPKCNTKLLQSKFLIIWYRWFCVSCGYNKILRSSISDSNYKAKLVFEPKVIEQIIKERS